jgi:hypothetical protein
MNMAWMRRVPDSDLDDTRRRIERELKALHEELVTVKGEINRRRVARGEHCSE